MFFKDKTHSSIFFTRNYRGREWCFYYTLNRNDLEVSIDVPDSESEALRKEIFEMLSKNAGYHWKTNGSYEDGCRLTQDNFDISSEYGYKAKIEFIYIKYDYDKPSSIIIQFRER